MLTRFFKWLFGYKDKDPEPQGPTLKEILLDAFGGKIEPKVGEWWVTVPYINKPTGLLKCTADYNVAANQKLPFGAKLWYKCELTDRLYFKNSRLVHEDKDGRNINMSGRYDDAPRRELGTGTATATEGPAPVSA